MIERKREQPPNKQHFFSLLYLFTTGEYSKLFFVSLNINTTIELVVKLIYSIFKE